MSDLDGRGVRVRLDIRTDQSFGWRSTDWELKGVPVRIEVGPRYLVSDNVTLVRRDIAEKTTVTLGAVAARVIAQLATIQSELLARATSARDERITEVMSLDEESRRPRGWAKLPWSAVGDEGEQRLAQDGMTVRCLQRPDGSVPDDDTEPNLVAYCGRAY